MPGNKNTFLGELKGWVSHVQILSFGKYNHLEFYHVRMKITVCLGRLL